MAKIKEIPKSNKASKLGASPQKGADGSNEKKFSKSNKASDPRACLKRGVDG